MPDRPENDLAALVATSCTVLHGIRSRTDPARIAAELERLNRTVRDLARGSVGPFDHPGDFAATVLKNADPTNG
jgi:aspartyl-tRNA(Asn)/glutamyl-tRNA(Gln) amidotransferase subunit A